ncbi:MAG: CDP-diacylglycerol--glycerol-3-phosphate 3-phosphatidyltransferase [Firmicutes bacterium]|nr:CDP-diacylglycerol--glycerol-3-phosphate 3-phosphatidyltransferase [Bacillota bacterium]
MKKMNLPNKITITRIVLSVVLLVFLMIPWHELGVKFPTYTVAGKIVVDIKYVIAGVVFMIASLTDFLDGNIARKRNLVTDFGKVMDAIADKLLVNGLLIIIACEGFIPIAIPVIIITRDTFVDSIKMASGNKGKVVAASKAGKLKTICMMVGLTLLLFYNLPFEIFSFRLDMILIYTATVLSVYSGCEYYYNAKDLIFKER